MSRRLEDELAALKHQPLAAGAEDLEPEVWRRIDASRQAQAATPLLLPLRAAAVFGALGIGVATGGVAAVAAAAEPHEISVFSIEARLAPSTLLDGH